MGEWNRKGDMKRKATATVAAMVAVSRLVMNATSILLMASSSVPSKLC